MHVNAAGKKSPFDKLQANLSRKQVLEQIIVNEQQQEIPQVYS
jgi:hypothetical protein